jgi:hypothetical protein
MSVPEQKYRHELKYVVSAAQIPLLRSRISGIMQQDSHAGETGKYNIRSLYFDDNYDSCYYENENGTDPREKFRIRIYNHSSGRITLECKRKERGKTLKTSCPLTLEQVDQLMNGQWVADLESQPPLLKKLLLLMRMQGMHPVVVVEYDRIPYIYRNGNVRVTFDTNIEASSQTMRFFDENMAKRPIMPAGMHLMEVKYDEYLPDFIYQSLNLSQLQQTAYSKYYLCRKFSKIR